MKLIPLTKGKFAKVDDKDYLRLIQYKWSVSFNGRRKECFYGFRNQRHAECGGKKFRRVVLMHRYILDVIDPKVLVDHINGDGLDNRRINLRLCGRHQKNFNQRVSRLNRSGFKGVHNFKGAWRAQIRANGERLHLGTYPSAREAALVYNTAARKYFGEFAWLNYVPKENKR